MSLREKLERVRLQDEDRGDNQGGSADDAPTVVPGPGETQDSMMKSADDKDGDKEPAKKAATDDDKKAEDEDKTDDSDDAKAAKKDDKDDDISGIPKSRLDAALNRAREAEKALRELRNQGPAAEPTTTAKADDDDDTYTIAQAEGRVKDLDIEIAKAMKDEEDESGMKLAVLIREQRELQEGIQEAKLEDFQTDSRAQTSEEIRFDRVVDELEEQIPQLNPEHKDYSEDLVQETITLAQALNAQGRTQADSMLLAVGYMSEKLGISKADVAAVKKETDIEKNVKLAKDLPPDLTDAKGMVSDKGGITKDSGKISEMTEPEFYALADDEARLKQLRGDNL